MLCRSRLILAALAATVLLAVAIGDASAGRFSTNEKNFEFIWNEALGVTKTKLELIGRAAGTNVQCKFTLLGRFRETTILKATGLNQGTFNHGEFKECEGGSATIRAETFPWNFRYRSFTGSLPRITSLSIGMIGARYRWEAGGIACETQTEANHPWIFILEGGLEATGEPENVISDRNGRIPLRGSLSCNLIGEGEFGGIGLIRNLPRTEKIRLTLI